MKVVKVVKARKVSGTGTGDETRRDETIKPASRLVVKGSQATIHAMQVDV